MPFINQTRPVAAANKKLGKAYIMNHREEYDSLGPVQVPVNALYGAQTRRAELNFPISGWRLPEPFLTALARLKRAAAAANRDLGRLSPTLASLIAAAASEIIEGRHKADFPLDVFQTGSATSTNMNMNEVIANRAIQLAGGEIGSKNPVHPNDHVNLGQSSNDLTPTASHIAAALEIENTLLPALEELQLELHAHIPRFDKIVKIGRTHLQDAVPIRMGQVFFGYAGQVEKAAERICSARDRLLPLALGGTAVGTGLNSHPEFPRLVITAIAEETGLAFVEADNHFAAQASMDELVNLAATLKTAALALVKIANDIRFLASGPRAGLSELKLPSRQPGSSIMPGKVNPVMCETLMQASAFAVGGEAGISFAAAMLSNFELAVAWPYASWQILETIRILAEAARQFARKAVAGLEADAKRCASLCEQSLALATSLAPVIGYDKAADLAKKAAASGKTIREEALAANILPPTELDKLLNPAAMTRLRDA